MSDARWIGLTAGLLCACSVTADGYAAGEEGSSVPNFSSIDRPWVAIEAQEFTPPASGIGPVTYDHAHPIMVTSPNNAGIPVTAPLRVADLNNPNLKDWVVEALKKSNDEVLAGKLRWTSRANCMPGGVPQFLLYAGGAESLYMIQTAKEIVMIHQANNETRHVYMNVPHSARPSASWYGESVGHFDGDELVVDTIGLNDRSFVDDRYSVPHTTQLHVIERFKLTDEGRTLQVNFTVEDPGAFNAPWSASVRYQHARQGAALFEEPCAENNDENLSNLVHSPTATRKDF
jgi:hypothetical protein